MAIQLTPEQEQRIRAVVNAGSYPSTEAAIEAAVVAVEISASPDFEALGFEGTPEELEALLTEGLNSGEPTEVNSAFWNRLKVETDQMVREQRTRTSRR